MIFTDLIKKKRDGHELTRDELHELVVGAVNTTIPDYQLSAFLMAVRLNKMTVNETAMLTNEMASSGEMVDLSCFGSLSADKHSTGGIGDKTTLIVAPTVAALGGKVAKMSGRALGHTGGTIDKLESFPGFTTGISDERFFENVNKYGIAIVGQTANLVPADKKIYALRDVTGTVPSIPLMVSSIMSKKLASGSDVIVLDVKCGSGSFMKTEDDARQLAQELVYVGKAAGRKTVGVITDMDEPLGNAIGNALEVKEAISVLRGETKGELLELCLTLGACMLTEAGFAANDDEAREKLVSGIEDGSALKKLAELVEAQGGDSRAVYDTSLLPAAAIRLEVTAEEEGYVSHIAADNVGLVSMHLGGGRATKESDIDLSVGLILGKKVGDEVKKGDVLGVIHASSAEKAEEAAKMLQGCYTLSADPVVKPSFIKGIVR